MLSTGAIQSMKRNFKLINSATHPRPNCVLLTCMLLLGGDIESNPGPVKFPCTMCGKPVAKNQNALACDVCEKWSHIKCNGVSQSDYRQFQHQFQHHLLDFLRITMTKMKTSLLWYPVLNRDPRRS